MKQGRLLALTAAVLAVCGATGCSHNVETVDDLLWVNGELQCIVCRQHYKPIPGRIFSLGYTEESGVLDGKSWSLIRFPIPAQPGVGVQRIANFAVIPGTPYLDGFLSIAGSEMFFHQSGNVDDGTSGAGIYDPKVKRDVYTFPPRTFIDQPILNRSRSACVGLAQGQAVIFDLLTVKPGEIKTTSVPGWTQWAGGNPDAKRHFFLTDNRQYLVAASTVESNPPPTIGVFKVEVLSVDGTLRVGMVPAPDNMEDLNDAEWVDGKLLVLLSAKTYPGTILRVCDLDGKTVYTNRVNDYPTTAHWDPSRHEILCMDSSSKFDPHHPPATVTVWNYATGLVTNVTVGR